MEKEEEKVVIKLHKVPLSSEKEEKKHKIRKTILLIALVLIVFLVGILVGYITRNNNVVPTNTSFANKASQLEECLDQVWLYKNDYEDLKGELENKALKGMTQFEDDPYTTYMSKEELEEFANSINMNYVGIGVEYTSNSGTATVTKVFKDSPAEKGGMLAGDVIDTINGESIEGWSTEKIKENVTGQEGTEVNIGVIRGGIKKELTFIRGAIDSTVFAKTVNDCVVLEIMSFGKNTVQECAKYLDEYKDYSKLIIDLRDNSGGYQDALEYIAGLFLGEDKIVLNETFNTGETKSYKTRVFKYYDNFKHIVVLTNGNTASAAEVLTISLKELHPDCVQVGETTYGKGVVQTTLGLSDGSCVKVTTSYWTSPSGVSINKNGVVPDVEVKLDDLLYAVAYAMQEDEIFEVDDVSSFISLAQQSLNYLGYPTSRNDGYFDVSTYNALCKFEEDQELLIDGKLDNTTYEALVSRVVYEYHTNPEKDVQMLKAIELLEAK